MMARYKRDELVWIISYSLGHDLGSRAIGRSSILISISDGDVKGKRKCRDKNSHISNRRGSPKLQQGRKRWQCTGTWEKSINKPSVREKNENRWRNSKEMSLP